MTSEDVQPENEQPEDVQPEDEQYVLAYETDGSEVTYYNYTEDGLVKNSYSRVSEDYVNDPRVWTYDDAGNVQSIIEYGVLQFDVSTREVILDPDTIWYFKEFEYDSSNNLIKTTEHELGDDTVEIEYDSDGREVHKIVHWAQGDVYDEYTTEYDEHGNEIKGRSAHYKDGELMSEFSNEYDIQYDDHGNVVEVVNASGNVVESYSYEYSGDRVTKKTDTSDYSYTIYRYDEERRLANVSSYTSAGELEDATIYSYDGAGNLNYSKVDGVESFYESGKLVRTKSDDVECFYEPLSTFVNDEDIIDIHIVMKS